MFVGYEVGYAAGNGSERRPRRSTKPTIRAMESAQQERDWGGSDREGVPVLVEVKRPVYAIGSRESEASGSVIASGSTRSGAKRRRESSNVPSEFLLFLSSSIQGLTVFW